MWIRPLASAFALALALAGSVAGGRADEPLPDLATVRANMKAALGAPPANLLRVIQFTLDGLPGTRVYERSGSDTIDKTEYGPLHRMSGTLAGRHWIQNDNGETVVDEPDPGQAAVEAFAATLRREGPNTIVLESLNEKGYGTRDFVNANTWLVQRHESISASGTTVTIYDDYRSIDGYTSPFHWSVSDGHPENEADYRVASETTSPLRAEDFAIPPSRKALVEFPADKTSVPLPAHLAHDRFVVELDINGHVAPFLLDTGAAGIFIDDDAADALGLHGYGAVSNGANAGRYVSRTMLAPEIDAGALRMHDVVLHTIPHASEERDGDGSRIVGLLGFDFIDAVALACDYQKGTVTATPRDAFVPPVTEDTYALDVRLGTGQPMTDVRINGALGERFVLDTGAVGSVLIDDYFARRYPGALVDEGRVPAQTQRYNGVGGAFATQPYQISSVQLGNVVRFRNFVVYRVTGASSYGGNTDGLLGSEVLKFFTMYTDYAHGKVYLQTNDTGRAAIGDDGVASSNK